MSSLGGEYSHHEGGVEDFLAQYVRTHSYALCYPPLPG